jgi:4-hydroxybenzoate polyprenyltransferase
MSSPSGPVLPAPALSVAPAAPAALFATVSRLHIVAIAALGTFTFGWLFFDAHLWTLAAISALDWFLVNILNRVVDLKEDRANAIVGTDFVADHRRAILGGGFGLLVASLAAVAFVYPWITPLRLAYHALGFAYNWPLFAEGRRIKQLYFWKNTASATGFLITVFAYPIASAGWTEGRPLAPGISWATIAASALFFFLFELSYEVIYDLRDAEGDRTAGVQTYPVVHGERGAVRIVDGLLAAAIAVLFGGYAAHVVPWRIFVMIAAPLLQLAIYKRALRRGITARDCVALTWLGVGLLLAYHLWVAAGLPGVGV